jgi:HK97 family phage portal protein
MPIWPFGNKRESKPRVEPVFDAIPDGAIIPSSDATGLHALLAGFPSTASGAVVNEQTAMQVSAVYACVNLIAGSIASLPLKFYERKGAAREELDNHDLWWLFNEQPCAAFTAATFWEFVVSQMLLRGDAIAYIYRGEGRFASDIKAIIPVPRSKVTIQRELPPEGYRGPTKLLYTFNLDKGQHFTVDQGDVLHFPGFGFNGLCSMSAIQYGARNAVGTAIQADEFAGKFFSQGAAPQIAITAPGQMSPEQQEALRQAFVAKYAGNGPSGVPLVLTEGLEIEELSMTAADAQLLESRKWQVVDIARAFGVPPFMIGEMEKTTSWGSGVEQMYIGFVRSTLRSHINRIQQELNRKLWPTRQKVFVEFDTFDLTAGDAASQADYFAKALGGTQNPAWMTQNQVRKRLNLPPMEGGDELHDPTTQEPPPNEPAPSQAAAG